MAEATKTTLEVSDFLTRDIDLMKKMPDFTLVGREEEVKNISTVLMRQELNNPMIYGRSGAGASSVMLGVIKSKEDPKTPHEIKQKRFYFLDTDPLFSESNSGKVEAAFKKMVAKLSNEPNSVLVIDDAKDFLVGLRNSHCPQLVNILMGAVRSKKFQLSIIGRKPDEVRAGDLGDLINTHSDFGELFSLVEINEPQSKDVLRNMVESSTSSMQKFHNVEITPEAVEAVVEVTTKFSGYTFQTAQPKRSKMILDAALTTLRFNAHSRPTELVKLEEKLATLKNAVAKGSGTGDLAGKSKEDLEKLKVETEEKHQKAKESWDVRQKKIHDKYVQILSAEESLQKTLEQIAELREKETYKKDMQDALQEAHAQNDKARMAELQKEYKGKVGDELVLADQKEAKLGSSALEKLSRSGTSTTAGIQQLESHIKSYRQGIDKYKEEFAELTEGLDSGLKLTRADVLNKFSEMSGQPLSKLTESTRQKLRDLGTNIKKRVFDQDRVIDAAVPFIRAGMQGYKDENKPILSIMLFGATGVGKTELAKALAEYGFGSEEMIARFDMGDYQEDSAVSLFVGSAPGLEGFTNGGRLVNEANAMPSGVVLFDEIEKGHVKLFDTLLKVVDEGTARDMRGVKASFGGHVIIFTSNIGARHCQDDTLSPEEVQKRVMEDVKNSGLRPEFLARIDLKMFMNNLKPETLVKIFPKEANALRSKIKAGITMDDISAEDAQQIVADGLVDKKINGRGVRAFFNENVKPAISDLTLEHENPRGHVSFKYDKEQKKLVADFKQAAEASVETESPANDSAKVPQPVPVTRPAPGAANG